MIQCNFENIAHVVYADIIKIRVQSPLVHNITNFVVMQSTANALLALGASPIMAHAKEELAEIINIAHSLVINIGTLDTEWIEAMAMAMQFASKRNIPIVLDPVGVGATKFRTDTVCKLIKQTVPTVIRGNASEILALAGGIANTKGVDSTLGTEQAREAAMQLATVYHNVVVISGKTDICLSSNASMPGINNGSILMTKVTGMGCTASSLIAAFCAVNSDPLAAAMHAMIVNGIAGELAAEKSNGPGSYQPLFYDALYNLTEQIILERLKLA